MNEKDILNSITTSGNSNTLTIFPNQVWDSTITISSPSECTVSADIYSNSINAAWNTITSEPYSKTNVIDSNTVHTISTGGEKPVKAVFEEPHVKYHNVFGLEYTKEIEKIMKGIDKEYSKKNGKKAIKETISKIKKIIFKNPATIIIWEDGTKTVVKCQNYEPFDEEKGLAMALLKHIFNESPRYNDFFTKCEDKIERL